MEMGLSSLSIHKDALSRAFVDCRCVVFGGFNAGQHGLYAVWDLETHVENGSCILRNPEPQTPKP